MKMNIYRKLCSIAASFLLCVSVLSGSFPAVSQFCMPASAAAQKNEEPAAMCVLLEGGVLPGLLTETLTDPESTDQIRSRTEMQDAVFEEILALYPGAEMRYRYTTLMNGFSCLIPESLADAVRALPGVSDVSRCGKAVLSPCMATAAPIGGIPDFCASTGCTGEGQVICVMDSELNLSHPMFAPLPEQVQVKLTKQDVRQIADTVGFHVQADPERLYVSSKIPFAADYVSADPYEISNSDPEYYHGSHVSGIAAGNAFTDGNGQTYAGVAKNAQIVFMAMETYLIPSESEYNSDYDTYMSNSLPVLFDTVIAMLEDAAVLRADVVNMSFGTEQFFRNDDHVLSKAISAAAEAGITVCISAGNDGEYSQHSAADSPDHSTMSPLITEGSPALAVASADNPANWTCGILKHSGKTIYCSGYLPDQYRNDIAYIGQSLSSGNYPYVYCGNGNPENFSGRNLNGCIALVERAGNPFTEMGSNAAAAGAVGLLVCNREDRIDFVAVNASQIPMAVITKTDGQRLKDAADKQIYISNELTSVPGGNTISAYSSWGMHASLELRPDITGIGGNVLSAAYGGGLSAQSGTSMSSPYLAGCTALINEYLTKTGCTLTGAARQQRIRNLLMTAAVPIQEEGLFVSPRRQGAGLVAVDRSAQTRVILTGAEGESKISLRDQLGTAFSFRVTAENIGTEDVEFATASLLLTTDQAVSESDGAAYLSGIQRLNCTADCSGLKKIAAGQKKEVTVSVRLDDAQAAELLKSFRNGFYIEGYLLLEGAAGHTDISIPLSGFSGDYKLVSPVSHSGSAFANGLNGSVSAKYSVLELAEHTRTVMEQQFKDKHKAYIQSFYEGKEVQTEWFDRTYAEIADIWNELMNDMEKEKDNHSRVYVSPNMDGVADQPVIAFRSPYAVSAEGIVIRDAAGASVPVPQYVHYKSKIDTWDSLCCGDSLTSFPEGDYTAELTVLREGDSDLSTRSETISVPFTVDRTPPIVKTSVTEKNGRRILTVTASDPILDGFVIFGKGSGGRADSYHPADPPKYSRLPLYYLETGLDSAAIPLYKNYVSAGSKDPEFTKTKCKPLIRLLRGDDSAEKWEAQFDFTDFIQAKPDKNGTYTLSYDITDFSAYSINVLDRACNVTELRLNAPDPANPEPEKNPLKPGVYRSNQMIIRVTEDTIRVVPFRDPADAETYDYIYDYQFYTPESLRGTQNEKGGMYLYCSAPDGSRETIRISPDGAGNIIMRGSLSYFLKSENSPDTQVLYPFELPDIDRYIVIGSEAAKSDFTDPYMLQYTGQQPDSVSVSISIEQREPYALYEYSYTDKTYTVSVNLSTGMAELPDGTKQKAEPFVTLTPGDVNLSGRTDVSDAVLLARFLAEDPTAVVTAQGARNADCNGNGSPDREDIILILRYIAKLIRL